MLAYHRVREAIAVELFDFIHIPGIPRVWEMLGAYCSGKMTLRTVVGWKCDIIFNLFGTRGVRTRENFT